MKNKKILTATLVAAMMAPIALGFAGCKDKKKELNINAKDVYAMCAASSVEYLKDLPSADPQFVATAMPINSSTRPSAVEEEDVLGIKNSLSMFDQIVQSGIKQSTGLNTSQESGLSGYNFVMEITFPNQTSSQTYKMYYNEVATETEEEIEDAKLEVEVSTLLDGVLVVDGNQYVIKGEREFEEEGNETESSIQFTTYLDNQNYITFEQSVEDDEIEYEYSIYKEGSKIQETEFELEKTKKGYEIEFQQANNSGANQTNTEYQIYVGSDSKMVVVVRKNKIREKITVEVQEGGYQFTYSNGYVETV